MPLLNFLELNLAILVWYLFIALILIMNDLKILWCHCVILLIVYYFPLKRSQRCLRAHSRSRLPQVSIVSHTYHVFNFKMSTSEHNGIWRCSNWQHESKRAGYGSRKHKIIRVNMNLLSLQKSTKTILRFILKGQKKRKALFPLPSPFPHFFTSFETQKITVCLSLPSCIESCSIAATRRVILGQHKPQRTPQAFYQIVLARRAS